LLLVSDVPVTPDGVKTEKSDQAVTSKWAKQHLEIGIHAMTDLKNSRDKIKHFRY
jgi:AMP nucleosidase